VVKRNSLYFDCFINAGPWWTRCCRGLNGRSADQPPGQCIKEMKHDVLKIKLLVNGRLFLSFVSAINRFIFISFIYFFDHMGPRFPEFYVNILGPMSKKMKEKDICFLSLINNRNKLFFPAFFVFYILFSWEKEEFISC